MVEEKKVPIIAQLNDKNANQKEIQRERLM